MAATGSIFLRYLSDVDQACLDAAQIALVIEEKWKVGNSTFPHIEVSLENFESALGRHAKLCVSVLGSIHAADFFIVVGALQKDPKALRALEELHLAQLHLGLLRWTTEERALDVVSSVREALVVGSKGHNPKLQSYAGTIPLSAWLRLVARRTLISASRRQTPSFVDDSGGALEHIEDQRATPEHEVLIRRHRLHVQSAIESACADLSVSERDLLRWHLVDGLGIDAIAPMLGVHRATTARMIHRAKSLLRRTIRQELRAQLKIGESSLDSLLASLEDEIEFSISKVLK